MYIENGKGKQQKGIKMWEGLQVIFLAFLVVFLVVFFSLLFDFDMDYDEILERRRQKKAKKQKQKHELKLEKEKTKQLALMKKQHVLPSKERAFVEFMVFVHKQTQKFSSISCKNDENLQNLLNETYFSILKLTASLNSDNYTNQEVDHFYKFELDQFFTLLGNGPDLTVDKEVYEKLCSCLKTISNEADRLENNIKEWQNFSISVKFDALIEYIKKTPTANSIS